MSKFKIKLKLTGLELEIEGSKDDVPAMAASIGQQLTGLLGPAASIAAPAADPPPPPPAPLTYVDAVPKRKRKAGPSRPSEAQQSGPTAIDFRHDPAKFGAPMQAWKTAEKAIWLLKVLDGEHSGAVIASTFNKHFRQSGAITVSNTNRDLGRLKSSRPPAVGEDTTKTPPA